MRKTNRSIQLAAICAAGLCVTVSQAADRVVLFEDVTATWCPPCVYAGQGLTMLLDAHPDSVVVLQEHVSDDYAIGWTNLRANKYGVTGIPHVICDGVRNRIGASNAQGAFNMYNYDYNWRMTDYNPTDLAASLSATEIRANVYNVEGTFTNEGTMPLTLEIQMVETLNNWPTSGQPGQYNYCVMNGYSTGQLTLDPGETETVSQQFTLHASSQANIEDVRFVTFGQVPGVGNQEIYNTAFTDYPFSTPCPGDLDGDGDTDQADLGVLLAAYNLTADGDLDGDGDTDQADLGVLLADYNCGA